MTAERTPRILIVGAGGIGGLTFDLVVPALEKVVESIRKMQFSWV